MRAQAMELAASGLSLSQIAESLGVSKTTAERYINRELAELQRRTSLAAEEYRNLLYASYQSSMRRLSAIMMARKDPSWTPRQQLAHSNVIISAASAFASVVDKMVKLEGLAKPPR